MKRSIAVRRLSACVLGAAVLVPVTAAGQAPPPGPGVRFDRTCYAPGDTITQIGRGFTPNAQIRQTVGLLTPDGNTVLGTLSATHTADASGGFTTRLRAPRLARASDRTEIAGSIFVDQAAPPPPTPDTPPGPTVIWRLSAWNIRIPQWAARTADPARSMTIDTYGWTTAGSVLYAHYYRGTTRMRSVRIGALTGACGNLRKQVRQFPFRGVRGGEWRVFFSATAVLDKERDPFIRRTVVVARSKATA
jgi:hypothetical protein